MKNHLFLLALPLFLACSSNTKDEPTLTINPREPITSTTIKDVLVIKPLNLVFTSEPFNPSHDATYDGEYEIDQPYDYPNKPGYGSGWNDIAPEEENLAKTQVPQELVEKMTTRALVQTCITHPMVHHYIRGENYYRKFLKRLIEKNNAFKELTKRPDGGWELAIAYNNFKCIEDGYTDFFTWGFVELMLENDIFLHKLTDVQLNDLYKALLVKYYFKEQHYPYLFSLDAIDIGLTVLPMAKIALLWGNFSSGETRQFLEDYVKNWDSFTTTNIDVLQAVAILTGSDLKVYEDLDVQANIDKLMGTWKVVTYGSYGHWRDYEKEGNTITFKTANIVEGNWLISDTGAYTIEGNNIKLITGKKDEGGMGIDYVMQVAVLTDDRLECYAYTTWPLSSWLGDWFILEKVK